MNKYKRILSILLEIVGVALILFTAIYSIKRAIWFDPALPLGHGKGARLRRYLLANVNHDVLRTIDFLFGVLVIIMVMLYIRNLLQKKYNS